LKFTPCIYFLTVFADTLFRSFPKPDAFLGLVKKEINGVEVEIPESKRNTRTASLQTREK
jgi:hypothetical protein